MTVNRRRLLALLIFTAAIMPPRMLLGAMRYEGIKFWVYPAEQPGAVRLWRLLLSDGSHLYTTDKREIEQLVASKRGAIEPMDAFVMQEPRDKMVRLYRFDQTIKAGTVRYFYTAFAPEAKEVTSHADSRVHNMRAYVFPHDLKPQEELAKQIVPVYCFYDPESGEHFYTSSEEEKKALSRQPPLARGPGAADKEIADASRQLATIVLGQPAQEGEELVQQFDVSIRLIRRTYPDLPPKEVAALIFAAHKQLEKFGKPLPLEKVAPLIATAIPRNQTPEARIRLNDVAAVFVGGYEGGDYEGNPEQAAMDARALMEELAAGVEEAK